MICLMCQNLAFMGFVSDRFRRKMMGLAEEGTCVIGMVGMTGRPGDVFLKWLKNRCLFKKKLFFWGGGLIFFLESAFYKEIVFCMDVSQGKRLDIR